MKEMPEKGKEQKVKTKDIGPAWLNRRISYPSEEKGVFGKKGFGKKKYGWVWFVGLPPKKAGSQDDAERERFHPIQGGR